MWVLYFLRKVANTIEFDIDRKSDQIIPLSIRKRPEFLSGAVFFFGRGPRTGMSR